MQATYFYDAGDATARPTRHMVLAIVLHARRPDEGRNIVLNAILGVIAAPVAFGRFVIAPL